MKETFKKPWIWLIVAMAIPIISLINAAGNQNNGGGGGAGGGGSIGFGVRLNPAVHFLGRARNTSRHLLNPFSTGGLVDYQASGPAIGGTVNATVFDGNARIENISRPATFHDVSDFTSLVAPDESINGNLVSDIASGVSGTVIGVTSYYEGANVGGSGSLLDVQTQAISGMKYEPYARPVDVFSLPFPTWFPLPDDVTGGAAGGNGDGGGDGNYSG
jgi:hypothetical protein